jgi:hypothetical protein
MKPRISRNWISLGLVPCRFDAGAKRIFGAFAATGLLERRRLYRRGFLKPRDRLVTLGCRLQSALGGPSSANHPCIHDVMRESTTGELARAGAV